MILSAGLLCSTCAAGEADVQNPFGVLEFLHWNHPWNDYKYPDKAQVKKISALMKKAGVGCVRMDFLWEDIEPQQGKFDFSKYDMIVDTVEAAGIQILGILDYTASWASAGGQWNDPIKDNKLFVNFASEVIRRYKGRIKYWELWNEPDSPVYWKAQDGLTSYCALLKEVYLAAKSIDPSCKILNGGLANGLSSVNLLYDNGAKDYFDILNIHFFRNPLYPGSSKGLANFPKRAYAIMSRNNDGNKKIWITEIGCPGLKHGIKVTDWWLGKNPTEDQQAKWVDIVYTELLKDKNIEKVFWAFFRDCNCHWGTGVDYFGLVRWDYSRKPAYFAYQKCFERWRENAISLAP
ncbi:MAG: beta-galactosidase [Candidatus Omnitrophota bacterium]|nr:beta-galactosidase [Candidatus Omnitrophota bacterium]